MKLSTTLRGQKQAQRAMTQIIQDLRGVPFLQAMRDATTLLTRSARMHAPVNTGRLRASIVPAVETMRNGVRGIVGSNVKYAPYMEFGTGTFVGRPRHQPPAAALERWAKLHGIASGYLVARSIGQRGGLQGRKYLTRAFDENKARVVQMLGEAVGRITSKGSKP